MTQRIDGIEPGRLACREVAEGDADHHGEEQGDEHHQRFDHVGDVEQPGDKPEGGEYQQNADYYLVCPPRVFVGYPLPSVEPWTELIVITGLSVAVDLTSFVLRMVGRGLEAAPTGRVGACLFL